MRARRILLVLAVLGIAIAPNLIRSPATRAGPLSLGAASSETVSRYTFVAGLGGSILVYGVYPKMPSPCVRPVQPVLHARFKGTIEVGRDEHGALFVIGVVSLED